MLYFCPQTHCLKWDLVWEVHALLFPAIMSKYRTVFGYSRSCKIISSLTHHQRQSSKQTNGQVKRRWFSVKRFNALRNSYVNKERLLVPMKNDTFIRVDFRCVRFEGIRADGAKKAYIIRLYYHIFSSSKISRPINR